MRTDGRSDTVVGGLQVGDPFTHGLVDGVLEGLRTGSDGDDLDESSKACQLCGIGRHDPDRRTFPPNILILNTFNACLLTSSAPM